MLRRHAATGTLAEPASIEYSVSRSIVKLTPNSLDIDSIRGRLLHPVSEAVIDLQQDTEVAMNRIAITTVNGKENISERLRIFRRTIFAVVTVLSVLLLLEGGARLVVTAPTGQRFQQINQIVLFLGTQPSDLMLEFDAERFWKLKPNISISDPDNTFWQGTVSNSHGFRTPEFSLQKKPGTLRIVCFGDSSTFGIGAAMEDTWPYQLQGMLQRNDVGQIEGPISDDSPAPFVEVINAGVPGYTSHQGLQHMRQEIDRLQPDVVLASYANNDFWHWDDQTDAQHAARLNDGLSVRRIVMQSRLAQLMDNVLSRIRNRPGSATQDISSPNQHWAEAATWNYKEPRREWTRRVPPNAFRENISTMADICAARNVPLVLVKWPDQPQAAGHWSPRIEYQAILDEIARDRHLAVADVVSLFQANRSWAVNTYVPNDIVHVNGDGNRLAAVAARDAIQRALAADQALTN